MVSALLGNRLIVRLFVTLILLATPLYATAQTTLVTLPDQLALQMTEGNSYYFESEFPARERYSVRNSVIDPTVPDPPGTVHKRLMESGVIDLFERTTYFTPDFINSSFYPDGPTSLFLHVRVLTFPSDQQAADYVNRAYADKSEELIALQSTESPTDLKDVPWNDEAVSGYTIPVVSTVLSAGLDSEFLFVNYTGQQGSIVIVARVSAPKDLAEPIAREMFYAQMACVQIDAPCGPFMVPVNDFPVTSAVEGQHGGGSTSTSVGEAGSVAPASEPVSSPVPSADFSNTPTSGVLLTNDSQVETSGN